MWDNKNMEEKAKKIIASNLYMTLATADESGKPWSTPVFFAHDDEYNLYWVSYTEAIHSKNIETRKELGVVIFDSTAPEGEGDGVYFDAEGYELDDITQINHAMKFLGQKVKLDEYRVKSINEVTGNAPWRIYVAKPKNISTLSGTTISGKYVDRRVAVNLL